MNRVPPSRATRRLLIAILALIALDPFVPGLVQRLEVKRYESGRPFRFENSDLFSVGPLTEYLREHPRGPRPRIAFFGNSFVWGYFLSPEDGISGQFQRLMPSVRVFNMAVNGFETGSAYIITKNIIEGVDAIYLFPVGGGAHPMLPHLMSVDGRDLGRFSLPSPDRTEGTLRAMLGFWNLYRYAYRLQASLFGTSTRQYVYLHKASLGSEVVSAVRGRSKMPPGVAGADSKEIPDDGGVSVEAGRSSSVDEARRRELTAAHPLLWDYAELVRTHRKYAIVVHIAGYSDLAAADRDDLNTVFAPYVRFVTVNVPAALKFDGLHLSAEGARAVAQALRRYASPAAFGT